MQSSSYSTLIAEPYAQALMSLAQSHHLTDSFGAEIRSLGELIEQSPDLQSVINNPVIEDEEKKNLLRRIMGEQSNPYLLSFLMLLVDKKRLMFLPAICDQFLVLLRQLNNTVLAEVTSAQELNEEQRHRLVERIKELTGAQSVELKVALDPDLIGGVVIKVGSQIYDSSLRGQLRRLSFSLGRPLQ